MTDDKWTDDAFLDGLRQQGDDLADPAVVKLHEDHGIQAVTRIFKTLHADHQPLPDDAPAPFREFMAATDGHPPGLDLERLNRGAEVFREHAFPASLVLLAASLPAGYSAPCLSRILTVSDNLGNHPYKRLMGVLQLIVDISSASTDEARLRAHLTAQKLRLLHAGIRYVMPRYLPDYRDAYGVPVNHEDMLATIMGFSYLVIDGIRRFELPLSDEEAEDYFYVWRTFALMMGIHPPGEPANRDYVPATVADAAAFYSSYVRRNYAAADQNPEGVKLARINLDMIRDLIPRSLRLAGLNKAPEILMQDLLGEDGMRRVGVEPITGHRLAHASLHAILRSGYSFTGEVTDHFATNFSLAIFQRMIDKDLGGEMRFILPEDLAQIRSEL